MGFLKRLSSRFHLALGLSSMVVSLLLAALLAGLLPDRDAAVRSGRTSLAEATGVAVTALLSEEDSTRVQQVLDFLVSRNPELLSIGLRTAAGALQLHAGPAGHHYTASADGRSTETHVRVPLLYDGGLWGHAELHFKPIEGSATLSLHRGSPALLVLAMGAASFVLFYLYLRRMLSHLDPSSVIPGRVRTAFDTLAEGVLVLDPQGRIVLANQAFAAIVGRAPDALVGQRAHSLGWAQPEGASADDTPWAALRGDGLPRRNVLLYLQDAEGKRRSFMANGSPVPGADGKPAGMLVSLDDVTALEEQEIQLRLARDAAEQANRAKSDFLANMSHEIRTPMNAILGFAELLRRGWHHHPQDAERHLDTILGSGRHLLALINDILDLSKVEAGRLEVERVDCAVHEVVHEVLDIMRVRAQDKGVGLELQFPQPLPALLPTDPARLRQIVTNLVGNALKFTDQGQVTVRVTLDHETDAAAARLHIDVADTGIGIPHDKLQAIFEPFVQASASTTRQFGGTGLGLAISRRFARALGGDIVATSNTREPGRGSCFHVSLVCGPVAAHTNWLQPEQLLLRTAQRPAADHNQHWEFEPATVLVVDDGTENRELVRLVLESAGLTVEEADNGAVAIQRVQQLQPALVLMDVQMPVMDGYTATRKLREQGCTLPVLALTANAMKGYEHEIAAAGFNDHLTKPVDIDNLLQTLAGYLPGRQVQAYTAAPSPGPVPEAKPEPKPEPVPAPAQPARGAPIHSRLATHPRLARVVRTFAAALPAKLQHMHAALAEHRFQELADLAHWLKGAGGTVGFDVFFEPARQLELQAREQDRAALQTTLAQLQALAARLVVPAAQAPASPPNPGPTRLTTPPDNLPVLDDTWAS